MLHKTDLMGMFDKQVLLKKFLIEETYLEDRYQRYHAIFKFKNGFGASIVYNYGTYGFNSGQLELAVIKFDEGGDWHLTYETEITSDVLGYLEKNEVFDTLNQIKNLK